MKNVTFEFPQEELDRRVKLLSSTTNSDTPKYTMGVDTSNNESTYCLMRHYKKNTEIIMLKSLNDKVEFWDEVNNLSKYFNATILGE